MGQEEHGYRLDGYGGNVCSSCVDDYALAELVAAEASATRCDFCDAQSEEPMAADVEIVLGHMGHSIATEYDQAVEALGSDEGEFVGSSTYVIYEVLDEEGWEGHPRFRELVMLAFSDGHYCQRDPYALSESEALHLGWREFRRTVQKEARFTFTLMAQHDDAEYGFPVLRGGAMLHHLGELINEYDLYRELGPGEPWIRVRPVHKEKADYTTAEELGAPPSHRAKPNRMSPAGIPMFYASNNEATSIEEALGARADGAHQDAMVAVFETTREGLVVDLTDVPHAPSLFDEANRHKRPRLGFLNGFARDVSRPLSPDDEQQTEYVPTQIVCEYLRHHFATRTGQRPVGLMFRSSKNEATINVVYFVGPESCLEPGAERDLHQFQLELRQTRRHPLGRAGQ